MTGRTAAGAPFGRGREPFPVASVKDPLECAFREAVGGGEAITSRDEWDRFTAALSGHGIVTSPDEQLEFQDLWDRAIRGVDSFGRRSGPRVSLSDVLSLAGRQEYVPRGVRDVEETIQSLTNHIRELGPLLDSWDVESLGPQAIISLIGALDRMKASHQRAIGEMERETQLRAHLATAEAIRCCSVGEDAPPPLESPLLWQARNRAAVHHAVSRNHVSHISFSKRDPKERTQVIRDSWGFTQGHDACFGIQCYGAVGVHVGGSSEIQLAAVSVPLGGVPHGAQISILKNYQAHRQLATSSAVCHVASFRERISLKEQLICYECPAARPLSDILSALRRRGSFLREDSRLFRHLARGALRCFAELQEQSTFGLRSRLTTDNIMVGSKGWLVRLGNIPWGMERTEFHNHNREFFAQRDSALSEDLASILEQMIGNGVDFLEKSPGVARLNLRDVLEEGISLQEGQCALVELSHPKSQSQTEWRCEVHDDSVSKRTAVVSAKILGKLRDDDVDDEDDSSRDNDSDADENVLQKNNGTYHSSHLEIRAHIAGSAHIVCESHEPFCESTNESDILSLNIQVRSGTNSAVLQSIIDFCRAQRMFLQDSRGLSQVSGNKFSLPREATCLKSLLHHAYMAPVPPSDRELVIQEYERLFLS